MNMLYKSHMLNKFSVISLVPLEVNNFGYETKSFTETLFISSLVLSLLISYLGSSRVLGTEKQ